MEGGTEVPAASSPALASLSGNFFRSSSSISAARPLLSRKGCSLPSLLPPASFLFAEGPSFPLTVTAAEASSSSSSPTYLSLLRFPGGGGGSPEEAFIFSSELFPAELELDEEEGRLRNLASSSSHFFENFLLGAEAAESPPPSFLSRVSAADEVASLPVNIPLSRLFSLSSTVTPDDFDIASDDRYPLPLLPLRSSLKELLLVMS